MGKSRSYKRKKCTRNNRQVGSLDEPKEIVNAPHTFVLHRGSLNSSVIELTRNFRQMMEPFTASSLRERKSNKIKDFVNISGLFHVSHMCVFYRSKNNVSFKVSRLPRGPTLTFRISQYTLARDVITAAKRQYVDAETFEHPPLVIMNSFSGEGKHIKLMASTFQNLFPTINLTTIDLSTVRRCVMISYNPETKLIDLRHYSIILVPVGLSKGIKKVVLGKVPNLSNCDDISDYITQAQVMSESELEDDAGHVILPQEIKSRGNLEDNKSAIVLHEIGPRITFQLSKIEDGLLSGEILFNEYVIKTEEEKEMIRKMRIKKMRLKESRRNKQNENQMRKEKERDEHKNRSMHQTVDESNNNNDEPDDDAQYYRDELGQEPDRALFSNSITQGRTYKPKYGKKKRTSDDQVNENGTNKKQKLDDKEKPVKNNGPTPKKIKLKAMPKRTKKGKGKRRKVSNKRK